MELGDQRITKEVWVEQVCCECGESATEKQTFLFEGARSNPNSKAYGKDDCSWCEDDSIFTCAKHGNFGQTAQQYAKNNGLLTCSVFKRERFEHMFLYWKKPEAINANQNRL